MKKLFFFTFTPSSLIIHMHHHHHHRQPPPPPLQSININPSHHKIHLWDRGGGIKQGKRNTHNSNKDKSG